MAPRQPFLQNAEVVLQAPAQVWSRSDGSFSGGVEGLSVSDVRILSGLTLTAAGTELEHVRAERMGADRIRFTALLRRADDEALDPEVRLDRDRRVTADGLTETLVVSTARTAPVDLDLAITLTADLAPMPAVKSGEAGTPVPFTVGATDARWSSGAVSAALTAQAITLEPADTSLVLHWRTTVPARGTATASWTVRAQDGAAVVRAPEQRTALSVDPTGDAALDAWLRTALSDLEALQLTLPDAPDDLFLAAGAPWFFTLFGRDSIWAARMLLPLDVHLAEGTLRVLARLQGTATDPETGERPGGILHELRRDVNPLHHGMVLPPHYYGTIDATPLWILLLHDAWRAGLPDRVVRELLPALHAALGWLRDAVSEDGFLAYLDESGHGLANQGWKDSGDSVQWRDGRLAAGPIALCEVQGYAHEAALAAVVLLRAFGSPDDAEAWTAWADALKRRFRKAFWIEDDEGGYPAIALDADGAAVDTLTSNIGHLLGSGLLDADDERRVATLLTDPRLDSGYGVRTLSADAAGYWPLSYHCGSVWAHDSAIAVHCLQRAGFAAEAAALSRELLDAAARFGYRMPELYAGDPSSAGTPAPYPAACRPQAWSAAAAVVVREALTPGPSLPTADRDRVPAVPTDQHH